ncbi:MAG: ketopantoate reductase family protein [Solobacterium sp.]|nr:ketopantoate reductase family protein [Solobacterium sp.]
MKIRKVTVIGAGAIGAYIYHCLLGKIRTEEISFSFIASGERKQRLETEGLNIQGEIYHPDIRTPEEAQGTDLLMVSVKYTALQNVLDDIRTIADEHTTVLSLLNGIDSEEIIAEVVDPSQVIPCFMRVAAQHNGRKLTWNPASAFGIYYGSTCPAHDSRVTELNELFEGTELPYHACDDIIAQQWHKYALNISANLPQAVLNVGTGAYRDSEHAAWMRDVLAAEVLRVAEAYGVHIDHVQYGKWKPEGRLSTLQDLDQKRKTEVDMFLGVLIRKAAAVGISVPYSEYTYHVIKALEEKNEGRFDY